MTGGTARGASRTATPCLRLQSILAVHRSGPNDMQVGNGVHRAHASQPLHRLGQVAGRRRLQAGARGRLVVRAGGRRLGTWRLQARTLFK